MKVLFSSVARSAISCSATASVGPSCITKMGLTPEMAMESVRVMTWSLRKRLALLCSVIVEMFTVVGSTVSVNVSSSSLAL